MVSSFVVFTDTTVGLRRAAPHQAAALDLPGDRLISRTAAGFRQGLAASRRRGELIADTTREKGGRTRWRSGSSAMTAARSSSSSAAGTERMPSASAGPRTTCSRPAGRGHQRSNSDGGLRPDQVGWAACSRTGVGLEHGRPGDAIAVRPDRPGGCDQCASTGDGLSIHPLGSSRRTALHVTTQPRRRSRWEVCGAAAY
jgi:hypothetical protein